MICTCCGAYFKQNAFNQSKQCEGCQDDFSELNDLCADESSYEADVVQLVNPSGKTRPIFLDDVVED